MLGEFFSLKRRRTDSDARPERDGDGPKPCPYKYPDYDGKRTIEQAFSFEQLPAVRAAISCLYHLYHSADVPRNVFMPTMSVSVETSDKEKRLIISFSSPNTFVTYEMLKFRIMEFMPTKNFTSMPDCTKDTHRVVYSVPIKTSIST